MGGFLYCWRGFVTGCNGSCGLGVAGVCTGGEAGFGAVLRFATFFLGKGLRCRGWLWYSVVVRVWASGIGTGGSG